MARHLKTSRKNRTSYIYYSAEGSKIVINPGKEGVTEADIELLHQMDDAEVDQQRRYDYRAVVQLDACDATADHSANPEEVYITQEDEQKQQAFLNTLAEAMENLLPGQRELVKKVYLDGRSNTDIAAEEGVTEAAIRNRLKKIHEKLRKYFF